MNILISNDDGIEAKGIHYLADCLSQIDDVNIFVLAPDKQRSCCGHGLTMDTPLNIKPYKGSFGSRLQWAYSCEGFPADCVRLGLFLMRQEGIKTDLVCSGINMGSNWGSDVFYSGTMAAARESAICFTQAIAFSLCSHKAEHFEHFDTLVPEVVKKSFGKLDVNTVLNVNVPDIPREEIKGIKVCRQGPMDYGRDYRVVDGKYILDSGVVVNDHSNREWDCVLGDEGYITLVPCDNLPFSESSQKAVSDLGISL